MPLKKSIWEIRFALAFATLSLCSLLQGAPAAKPIGPAPKSCDFQRGWTSQVTGGLGGEIIPVTNLNKSGKGSLKAALDGEGPRVVVFEVGGFIDLDGSILKIRNPHVTIAGQTAPSPGITLIRGGLSLRSHDIVVQHLRVRPGAAGRKTGWEPDGIAITSGHNIVVDHCSISWAVDENLSASGPRFEGKTPADWRRNTSSRITFSNNIVAEALDKATHPKGAHSKGSLIHDNVSKVLMYRNLYSSNRDRNPRLKGGTQVAIVNNYIVNPGFSVIRYGAVPAQWRGKAMQTGELSLVGNIVRYGADTRKGIPVLRTSGPLKAYMSDNLGLDRLNNPIDETHGDFQAMKKPPIWPANITVSSVADLEHDIWPSVGARPWDRDAVDSRIVRESRLNTGKIIDSELEIGGYGLISASKRRPFSISDWDECFQKNW